MDINVYNYENIKQDELISTIEGLKGFLKDFGIDASMIKVVDGNIKYPDIAILIKYLLNYFNQKILGGIEVALVDYLHGAFLYLYKKSKGSDLSDEFWVSENQYLKSKMDNLFVDGLRYVSLCNSIIVPDKEHKLKNEYGDAQGNEDWAICLIRNLNEYSIWHEAIHLLGVEDHYCSCDYSPRKICSDVNCIMRWDNLRGKAICQSAVQEIKRKLSVANF